MDTTEHKRIFVLGAGRGQTDLIRAVRRYGHTAIVASIPGDYPGFALADEICHVNIADPEAVCAAARELRADAVVTACLDTGIAALGYTCEKLGLPGLSEQAARLSGDKLLMKRAFMAHGVSTARFRRIRTKEEALALQGEFTFPLIVKAVDLQGSRGINIARNEEELKAGFERTMAETGKDFCIIEEFIEGYEFGAQAFVYDHKVLFVMPAGDITFLGNTNVPVGHYVPLEIDDELHSEIVLQVEKAIAAIGLNNCAVNVDMILRDGQVYLIELTGRIGANCLPQLTSTWFGVDIYKMILDAALGVDPEPYFLANKKAPTPCYAKMLISDRAGTLKRIVDRNAPDENVLEFTAFVKPGDEIRKFTNSRDCVGEVVVRGTGAADCLARIDRVVAGIEFELE